MSDISKCNGKKCPLKHKCWRYLAPTDPLRQSYVMLPPEQKESGKCDIYWPVNELEKAVLLKEDL